MIIPVIMPIPGSTEKKKAGAQLHKNKQKFLKKEDYMKGLQFTNSFYIPLSVLIELSIELVEKRNKWVIKLWTIDSEVYAEKDIEDEMKAKSEYQAIIKLQQSAGS